jgi:nucleoside-diphosphate-sugar epimerase
MSGGTGARTKFMRSWLLRALGFINPTVRELLEMQYQFEEPFVVDSSKITARLGIRATPLEQALAETLLGYAAEAPSR